jgi:hypothetical protein
MTIRGTLVLAAILLALAAYLVVTRPPPGPSDDGGARLTESLERATTIELEQGGRTVRLARGDRAWAEARASDVFNGLQSLRVLTVIDPTPANAALYGFGADALRLRVLGGTDVLLALEVGAMNPAETGVYVRRIGEPPVLLVGALLRWELEKLRRVFSETAQP